MLPKARISRSLAEVSSPTIKPGRKPTISSTLGVTNVPTFGSLSTAGG